MSKFWPGDLALFYPRAPAVVVLCHPDYYDCADDEFGVLRSHVTTPQQTHGLWEKWRDAAVRESALVARPRQ